MEHDETPGMDRRDLLKRGAVVGGALVWTAPLVQTIASPAFAATSPGGQEFPGCPGSFFFKHETGRGATRFERSIGNGDDCIPTGYATSPTDPSRTNALPPGLVVTYSNGNKTVMVQVPAGFTLTSYIIKVGQGQQEACQTPTPTTTPGPNGSTIYLFTVTSQNSISHFSGIITCV